MSGTVCPVRRCPNAKHPRDFLCLPHWQALPWMIQSEVNMARLKWHIAKTPPTKIRLDASYRAALAAAEQLKPFEQTEFAL